MGFFTPESSEPEDALCGLGGFPLRFAEVGLCPGSPQVLAIPEDLLGFFNHTSSQPENASFGFYDSLLRSAEVGLYPSSPQVLAIPFGVLQPHILTT